jgi:hypothetical protein
MKTFTTTDTSAHDLVHMVGSKDDYIVTENSGSITYTSESWQRTYVVSGNEQLSFKRPDSQGKTKFKWNEEFSPFQIPTGTIDNPFTSSSEAQSAGVSAGLYYFINSNGHKQELFYKDGWILITSNNAKSSTIPSGTARNDLAYTVNRNGAMGALGEASPESDYIIGDFISTFGFTEGRILGWGRNSTNNTYSLYPTENLGTYIDVQWSVSDFDTVTHRDNVTIFGELSSSAEYFMLDSVKKDISLNANSNQSTVGGAGVKESNGDSSGGCYLGHGSSEGNFEGWYNNSGNANAQGYTTWVR